jgi:DNA-binding response OmpR family regulator
MPKLLVVDDEVDVQEFAKRFFEKRDVAVVTTGDGVDAMALVESERPDIILLDVHMEKISGVEVLRQLRDKGDQTKVIMVTGVEDEQTIEEAKSLGVLNYIHKPLVLDELEKIVMAEIQS